METYSKYEKKKPVRVMIFSKGSVPKCTFINNGDPLVVVKRALLPVPKGIFFSFWLFL